MQVRYDQVLERYLVLINYIMFKFYKYMHH